MTAASPRSYTILVLSGTPEGKAKAAGALWRLARNDDNRTKIAKWGGVPALIALLKEGNVLGRDRATAALESLALNAEARAKMAKYGYAVE